MPITGIERRARFIGSVVRGVEPDAVYDRLADLQEGVEVGGDGIYPDYQVPAAGHVEQVEPQPLRASDKPREVPGASTCKERDDRQIRWIDAAPIVTTSVV